MSAFGTSDEENERRAVNGKLYYAFTPALVAKRNRAHQAVHQFNLAGDVPRRELVRLWRIIVDDKSPLPSKAASEEEDSLLFRDDPYIDGPIKVDYGTNIRFGKGVYINFNCTFLDTCLITIGDRTLVGPNCSFYSATHPLDPFLRNGINGPELGAPITIGKDCWLGGNTILCPGVTLGRGVVCGAGSVVTKDVPAFHVVAGNPARIIRKIEPTARDPTLPEIDEEVVASAIADRV